MPPQLTTKSAFMSPFDVLTPVTVPFSWVMAVTVTPSIIWAPIFRAPLAKAWVMLTGSACPSLSKYTPPIASERFKPSYFCAISLGEISSISTPNARAIAAPRRNSSIRASVRATVMEPFCLKPVATPVVFSRFAYNS